MADKLNGIIISEVLADNPTGTLDVNNSGQANKQDEFIEFQNTTSADVDLAGYQVWSQEHGLLHTFAANSIIETGGTVLVLGDFDPGDPGNGSLDNYYAANGNNNDASANGGFLEDGEGQKNDTLYLVAPNGDYIQLSYGQNLNIPTSLPSGFPTGGTLQGTGEAIASGAPNTTSFVRDGDGDFVEGPPTPGTPGVPCFTAGTVIATDNGHVCVEDLKPGMRVQSKDNGYVTLRAMRSAIINPTVLRWNPDLRPVTLPAGVLGNKRTLTLSPAHRVLLEGLDVALVCGASEALVPVHHFVGQANIERVSPNRPVTYYHLLFDSHEVISNDGIWSESLFMGDVAHEAIRATEEWDIETGYDLSRTSHARTARTVLKWYEAAVLIGYGIGLNATAEQAA